MALRVSKAVLIFAIALFYTILVLNNVTNYSSSYELINRDRRNVPQLFEGLT